MTADELRTIIKNLDPVEDNGIWSRHRRSLRRHILEESPETFLAWSTVQATMYVGNAPYIQAEYEALDLSRYGEAIKPDGFGPAHLHGYDTNLIHQAYHLSQWERVTGQRVENLSRVIEFGGGYGAMYLLCRRLGYRGSYWIEDLPELSALQSYYLAGRAGQIYLGHLYYYKCDLFIASHSLSEISLPERERVLSGLRANSFLFVYHCEHDGIDNLAWFTKFKEDRPDYEWQQWDTLHFENQQYLVGIKR